MTSNTSGFKVCPNCQTPADLAAGFCSRCGHQYSTPFAHRQAPYGYPAPNPNWAAYGRPDSNRLLITLLLWFFVGHFGAHRFYLGHNNSAFLMLALELVGIATACIFVGWAFIAAVAIWWIVDLVQILTGNLLPTDGTRLV